MLWETHKVCKKCPIYHETQCSHRPYLPCWPEVVFTERFDPFHATTSLAGMGELEVSSYGRFDPAMPAAPPSLTRVSRRLVFIHVSIPFVPCHLPHWQERAGGRFS